MTPENVKTRGERIKELRDILKKEKTAFKNVAYDCIDDEPTSYEDNIQPVNYTQKKNVCIIHYNTPVLTSHLIKSINKHTPGTNIYVFDNSDKLPFQNTFDNVTVFDNTKGQIINFQTWLKKYPNKNKSGGKANKWGSAKHAYSVEKCMDLIKEPFVLFDSDVLVKKDFTPLFDDIVCYKGEVIYQPNSRVKRVLPFICFINTPFCRQKKIH